VDSIFYGYPTFAWIPTHNLNHHKFVNKPGDATITWRFTNRNNALVGITYFFVSSYYQSGPIKEFIRKAKAGNPKLYRQIVTQYMVWAGAHLSMFALAVALHGFRTGLYVYTFAFGIPAFFALWTIMFFNYGQHVHTDPWSKHNHSRTFNSRLLNFLLFNNGLHTAHHESASAHWSTLREVHDKIAPEIHPELNLRSFWWWVARSFFLAPFFPSARHEANRPRALRHGRRREAARDRHGDDRRSGRSGHQRSDGVTACERCESTARELAERVTRPAIPARLSAKEASRGNLLDNPNMSLVRVRLTQTSGTRCVDPIRRCE
jgi:fatty acid desaturase